VNEQAYIWIVRWGDFQHYAPERDRAPAWIKNYTKQHDDERYTDLTLRRRAVLHDLRLAFARASGLLRCDTQKISGRILAQVRVDDIKALSDAGFIQLVSREVLEARLEDLYSRSRQPSSPRARPRAREEVDREEEVEKEIDRDPSVVSEVPPVAEPTANSTGISQQSEPTGPELIGDFIQRVAEGGRP
jgi:hypothetical protein